MKLGQQQPLAKQKEGVIFFVKATLLFVAVFLGVGLSYAYFTARAASEGELFFANICADFVTSNDTVYTTTILNQQLSKIEPGGKYQVNTIYLKNTGEYDVYALLEVTLNAYKSGQTTAGYTSSSWYNLSGTELTGDKTTTNVEASLVTMGAKTQTIIILTIPGALDNDYKAGTATLNIKAHVIQSLLQTETGVSTAVTASRLIYQNKDVADVEHTVYIRPNGGTYNSKTENVTISQDRGTTITLSTPTRTGYTFKGWSLTGDGSLSGSTYTFGKSVGSITATWQPNKYNVTFDYNGASTNNNLLDVTKIVVDANNSYDATTNTLTAPTYSGNTYSNSKMQFFSGGSFLKEMSRTHVGDYYYATFTMDGTFDTLRFGFNGNKADCCIKYSVSELESGKTYTVSLKDTNKYSITTGTLSEFKIEEGSTFTGYSEPTKPFEYDNYYGTLPTPTREGYTFTGWQGVNMFDKSKYLLTSDYNQTSPYTNAPIKLEPNTTYVVSVYRKNGYEGKTGYLLLSDDKTINHNWTGINHTTQPNAASTQYKYTTTADGLLWIGYYNGTLSQSSLNTIWANTDVVIRKQTGNLTGGHFNTTTTEYESSYQPFISQGYVTSGTKMQSTVAHTLVAQWQANNYTVRFNANGGSISTTSKSVTYNGTYGELPTPTRAGYTFLGWAKDIINDTGSRQVTDSQSYGFYSKPLTENLTSKTTYYVRAKVKANVGQILVAYLDGGYVTMFGVTATGNWVYLEGTYTTGDVSGYTHGGTKVITLYNIPSSTISKNPASLDGVVFTCVTNGTKTSSTIVDTAADHTLYAQWSKN